MSQVSNAVQIVQMRRKNWVKFGDVKGVKAVRKLA